MSDALTLAEILLAVRAEVEQYAVARLTSTQEHPNGWPDLAATIARAEVAIRQRETRVVAEESATSEEAGAALEWYKRWYAEHHGLDRMGATLNIARLAWRLRQSPRPCRRKGRWVGNGNDVLHPH